MVNVETLHGPLSLVWQPSPNMKSAHVYAVSVWYDTDCRKVVRSLWHVQNVNVSEVCRNINCQYFYPADGAVWKPAPIQWISLLLTGVKKTLMSFPLSIFLGNLGFEQPLGNLHVQLQPHTWHIHVGGILLHRSQWKSHAVWATSPSVACLRVSVCNMETVWHQISDFSDSLFRASPLHDSTPPAKC